MKDCDRDEKNRHQGLGSYFDDWAALKDAYRLDLADHDIFDDRYSFPHRALCFSEMGKFVGAP